VTASLWRKRRNNQIQSGLGSIYEKRILCTFASLMTGPDVFSQLLYGATGVEEFADPNYMWVVGERIVNLERMFNAREGFTREDDRMPERIVKEPLPYGRSGF